LHRILVDGTHDPFGIGVGAPDQVEGLVLRGMDGIT
jgi:hypothetical protein